MKKILALILSVLPFGISAFAAEPLPNGAGDRILWAIKCSGNAPARMYVCFALLVACIIISVIYYKKISGGDSNAE